LLADSGFGEPAMIVSVPKVDVSNLLPYSTTAMTLHAAALEAEGMNGLLTEPDPVRRMCKILANKLVATSGTLSAAKMKPIDAVPGEVIIGCAHDRAEAEEAVKTTSWFGTSPKKRAAPKPSWRVVVEQVSDDPPVAASAAEGESGGGSFRQVTSTTSVPVFYGNYVEVRFEILSIESVVCLPNGQKETYVIKSIPSIFLRGVLGVGSSYSEWGGELVAECVETGLVGIIKYHPAGFFGRGDRHRVSGSVSKIGCTNPKDELCQISGNWTQRVVATMANGKGEVELLSAPAKGEVRMDAISALPNPLPYQLPPHSLKWARHSHLVWGELTAALHARDWTAARAIEALFEERRKRELSLVEGRPASAFFRLSEAPEGGKPARWVLCDQAFTRAFDPMAEQLCRPW
jgi:hypothetical protein